MEGDSNLRGIKPGKLTAPPKPGKECGYHDRQRQNSPSQETTHVLAGNGSHQPKPGSRHKCS